MKKLSALSRHLLSLPGIGRDQVEAFADMGTLKLTCRDLGHGLEIGRFQYDAVISMERFPARLSPLLLADLLIWLGENDPDRDRLDLSDPDIDVTLEDEQTVFVQITITFDEPICIVPDPAGPLFFEGQNWRVDDVPMDTAEVLDRMEKR